MGNSEEKKPVGELLVYQGQGIDSPIHVRLEGDTVWLSQKQLSDLYGTSVPNINQHITGVYEDEELAPEATVKKYLIVQTEGTRQVKRLVDHYNLDMIIAVGFRVRSKRGGQFRKWATERIGEYLVKGFTMENRGTVMKCSLVESARDADYQQRLRIYDRGEMRGQEK